MIDTIYNGIYLIQRYYSPQQSMDAGFAAPPGFSMGIMPRSESLVCELYNVDIACQYEAVIYTTLQAEQIVTKVKNKSQKITCLPNSLIILTNTKMQPLVTKGADLVYMSDKMQVFYIYSNNASIGTNLFYL